MFATTFFSGSQATSPGRFPVILLVEDDPTTQALVKLHLKKCCIVEIVDNGNDALRFCEKARYDLIFMDINIKGEMDGVETMKMIKEEINSYANVPFVAFTAYSSAHDKTRFLSSGFDYFLGKPFLHGDLEEMVNTVIRPNN